MVLALVFLVLPHLGHFVFPHLQHHRLQGIAQLPAAQRRGDRGDRFASVVDAVQVQLAGAQGLAFFAVAKHRLMWGKDRNIPEMIEMIWKDSENSIFYPRSYSRSFQIKIPENLGKHGDDLERIDCQQS